MCTAYEIDGQRLETGADLVQAIGREASQRVNPAHGAGERLWLEACLCHVVDAELSAITGKTYAYDVERDAKVEVGS